MVASTQEKSNRDHEFGKLRMRAGGEESGT